MSDLKKAHDVLDLLGVPRKSEAMGVYVEEYSLEQRVIMAKEKIEVLLRILGVDTVGPICGGCKKMMDPDTCWCGDIRTNHINPSEDGHVFVPMGCDCYRNTA